MRPRSSASKSISVPFSCDLLIGFDISFLVRRFDLVAASSSQSVRRLKYGLVVGEWVVSIVGFCSTVVYFPILFVMVLLMSTSSLFTPSSSQPSTSPHVSSLSSGGQVGQDLAARIEQQRAKIRALEHAAEERRRAAHHRAEQRHEDRLAREAATSQALLRHKAIVARDAEIRLQQGRASFRRQEELRGKDREARDDSAMQALLRYQTAEGARKAEEYQLAETRKLAKIKRDYELAEEGRRLSSIEEKRQRDLLSFEGRVQRGRERDALHQAALYAFQQSGAAQREREQQQLLARQRRKERGDRIRADREALARHEAAAKISKAQEVEARKLVKLKEAEYKRVLRDQKLELRRAEKRERRSATQARKAGETLLREEVQRQRNQRSLGIVQRQAVRDQQEEVHRHDREKRDEAGRQAIQRHRSTLQAQKAQQKSLTEGRIVAFDGTLPSFLDEEYQYMKQASADFPEEISAYNQMRCMRDYQRAISDASRRLPCGICGGLFQEDEMISIGLRDDNLQYFLYRTRTAPDCCAVRDDVVSLCANCSLAITKRAIPPLSAGNFVNCLFCQDYPEALKNLNTIEEAFIARAHVVGIFLKLTSGAQKGISYRGSRGHSVAVRQDPSELLKILPAARLRDHTTITVSWDRGAPPSEENLARFCSVDKAKVVNALLWLCAHNPGYKSVVVDYSVLDSWPDHHIPQEIRDAFITLGSEPGSRDAPVEDEREGYALSLQDGLFENELDAEVEDAEPGSILSRSFFSDLHGQDPNSTPATLASLQAILKEQDSARSGESDAIDVQLDRDSAPNDNSRLPHISYKTTEHLPPMNAFTDPDYFTAAFPTLFPFGIGGHLGDANGDRPEVVSLKTFARYTMFHHSLL